MESQATTSQPSSSQSYPIDDTTDSVSAQPNEEITNAPAVKIEMEEVKIETEVVDEKETDTSVDPLYNYTGFYRMFGTLIIGQKPFFAVDSTIEVPGKTRTTISFSTNGRESFGPISEPDYTWSNGTLSISQTSKHPGGKLSFTHWTDQYDGNKVSKFEGVLDGQTGVTGFTPYNRIELRIFEGTYKSQQMEFIVDGGIPTPAILNETNKPSKHLEPYSYSYGMFAYTCPPIYQIYFGTTPSWGLAAAVNTNNKMAMYLTNPPDVEDVVDNIVDWLIEHLAHISIDAPNELLQYAGFFRLPGGDFLSVFPIWKHLGTGNGKLSIVVSYRINGTLFWCAVEEGDFSHAQLNIPGGRFLPWDSGAQDLKADLSLASGVYRGHLVGCKVTFGTQAPVSGSSPFGSAPLSGFEGTYFPVHSGRTAKPRLSIHFMVNTATGFFSVRFDPDGNGLVHVPKFTFLPMMFLLVFELENGDKWMLELGTAGHLGLACAANKTRGSGPSETLNLCTYPHGMSPLATEVIAGTVLDEKSNGMTFEFTGYYPMHGVNLPLFGAFLSVDSTVGATPEETTVTVTISVDGISSVTMTENLQFSDGVLVIPESIVAGGGTLTFTHWDEARSYDGQYVSKFQGTLGGNYVFGSSTYNQTSLSQVVLAELPTASFQVETIPPSELRKYCGYFAFEDGDYLSLIPQLGCTGDETTLTVIVGCCVGGQLFQCGVEKQDLVETSRSTAELRIPGHRFSPAIPDDGVFHVRLATASGSYENYLVTCCGIIGETSVEGRSPFGLVPLGVFLGEYKDHDGTVRLTIQPGDPPFESELPLISFDAGGQLIQVSEFTYNPLTSLLVFKQFGQEWMLELSSADSRGLTCAAKVDVLPTLTLFTIDPSTPFSLPDVDETHGHDIATFLFGLATAQDDEKTQNTTIHMPRDQFGHEGAMTEWWWHVGTLTSELDSKRRFGFLINALGVNVDHDKQFLEAQGAITDVLNRKHYGAGQTFPWSETWCEYDPSKTWYAMVGTVRMTSTLQSPYLMHVECEFQTTDGTQCAMNLNFAPTRDPLLVGGSGVIPSGPDKTIHDANFYYSWSSLMARGRLAIGSEIIPVVGTTWMDHEYGVFPNTSGPGGFAWIWINVQVRLHAMKELCTFSTFIAPGVVSPGKRPKAHQKLKGIATGDCGRFVKNEVYETSLTPLLGPWPIVGGYFTAYDIQFDRNPIVFRVVAPAIDQTVPLKNPKKGGFEGVAECTVFNKVTGTNIAAGTAWLEQTY